VNSASRHCNSKPCRSNPTHLEKYRRFRADAERADSPLPTRAEAYFPAACHLIDACAGAKGVHIGKPRRVRQELDLNPILFGSAARGEAAGESDLDLVLVPSDQRQDSGIYSELAAIRARHEVTPCTLTTDPTFEDLDRQVLGSILRQGKPLKGGMPDARLEDLELRPERLIGFWLDEPDQGERARLDRSLFGYGTVKRAGRKLYRSKKEGFIHQVGGEQVGPGTILVPESAASTVERLLVSHGAKRWMIPIWEQAG
jgi:hypothetical protein